MMKKQDLWLLMILFPVFTQAKPVTCGRIFSAPAHAELFLTLDDIDLKEGLRNTPTWTNFAEVDALHAEVQRYSARLQSMTPEERTEARRALEIAFEQDPDLSSLYQAVSSGWSVEKYQPGQYGLRKKLVERLMNTLRLLPRDLRPPVAKVPFDPRLRTLVREGEAFMRGQVEAFDKLFPTTGHETYAEYVQALKRTEDPVLLRAIELIENDQLEIVMRRPENGRFWIPKTGFQNQYVSGSSKGYNGKTGRYRAEATMTSKTYEEYAPIDDEVKPKYGTIQAKASSGVQSSSSGASQYGSDIYVFKMDKIRDRVSVFPGDTLNHLGRIHVNWQSEVVSPASWDMMFIPWERRLLLAPFMVEGLRENQFQTPANSPDPVLAGYHPRWHSYWESQIFGRIDLTMVEEFRFEREPPSGEFLAELKRHGIRIVDARNNETKPWTEGAP